MEWLNTFGLIFIGLIMIPNIIYTIKKKARFGNTYHRKALELVEQIGRFACIASMIFNIPRTWFGWWSDEAFAVYLIVNSVLIVLYCAIWAICWKKQGIFKALALSIIPSVVFLFSGIMSRSVLLIISALLFAPAHILISYKNAA